MSVGGHVESGETYDYSFKRETQEELNIDIDTVPYRLLGHLSPKDDVSAYMNVYEIRTNEAPHFNPTDFTEYYWLTPRAFFEKVAQGEQMKSDLPKLVKIFYGE